MSDCANGCNDKLELIERKRLNMTCVESVDGFNEQCLNLTVAGSKLRISGEGIKITAYNKDTGVLSADGCFNEIRYTKKAVPIFKKIFK